MTRRDGRNVDLLRPVTMQTDFLQFPEGCCLISCGNTKVLCTASVEEGTPPHVAPGCGWVTAEYSMLPRANRQRSRRDIDKLKLSEKDAMIAEQIIKEIRNRLSFLKNVGLDYLTLSRAAEARRSSG